MKYTQIKKIKKNEIPGKKLRKLRNGLRTFMKIASEFH